MRCNTCENIAKCNKTVECKEEPFCYNCNYVYGSSECNNCTYYELGDENMEEKIEKITKESIAESIMERNIPLMTVELMQSELRDAFNKAQEEYPSEVGLYITRYIDLHPIANIIMTLRSIDNLIALKYLNEEVSGAEFDHMRVYMGIFAYFYYEHIIEEVDMDEFFSDASIKASEKFLKEVQ